MHGLCFNFLIPLISSSKGGREQFAQAGWFSLTFFRKGKHLEAEMREDRWIPEVEAYEGDLGWFFEQKCFVGT